MTVVGVMLLTAGIASISSDSLASVTSPSAIELQWGIEVAAADTPAGLDDAFPLVDVLTIDTPAVGTSTANLDRPNTATEPVAETRPIPEPAIVASSAAPTSETLTATRFVPEAQPVAAPSVTTVVAAPTPVPAALGPVERWQRENIILVDTELWDARTLAAVDQALALLPARIRAGLGNPALGPLMIGVNTAGRTVSGQQPYGGAANFYSTNEGRNEVVLFPGQGAITVLHELGHAFNLRSTPPASYAQVLLQSEMQSFMAAAGWQITTPSDQLKTIRNQTQVAFSRDSVSVWPKLSREDPLEDFANSFAYFYGDPGWLRQLSPARYDWFVRNLGQ